MTPAPKRRWLRFSLRTMFVVVTALAIYMGVVADRVWRQKAAVRAVLDNPGSIRYDYEQNGLRHPPGPLWLQRLIGKEWFQQIVSVNVRSTLANDRLLEKISDLRGLESLDLSGTRITDDGLRSISKLKKLQKLDVSSTSVGDKGLAHISGLSELVRLDLQATLITDEGLLALEPLKKLSSLRLRGTAISDQGLQHLVQVVHLSELDLYNTYVTDKGLKSLAAMKSLTSLILPERGTSDKAGYTRAGEAELRASIPAAFARPRGSPKPTAQKYSKRP